MRTLKKWTVSEYHDMINRGVLDHKRVELLAGELIEMAPESPQHCYAAEGGRNYLTQVLGRKAVVREAHPITLSLSEPEPDIAVVKSPRDNYGDRHPSVEDIFWLVEVSNSTLAYDLNEKREVYAQEGIKEYWVIDLVANQLHIFKDLVNGEYCSMTVHTKGSIVPDAFPNVEISVAKLLR